MSKQMVGYKIYEMILGLALVSIIVRAGSAINTDSAVQTMAYASQRLNIPSAPKAHVAVKYPEPAEHKGTHPANRRVQSMLLSVE